MSAFFNKGYIIGVEHLVTNGATGIVVDDVTYIDLPRHTAITLYENDPVYSWDFEMVDITFFQFDSDVWDGRGSWGTLGYQNYVSKKLGV